MYTIERNVQIVIYLLKANGIKKVFACPGTTNLTFVASIQNDPFFEIYSCVDERSAAYMACGMAAESGEAVCLSCTGATASRNFVPALTEAYYRKLPIIAITSTQVRSHVGNLFPQTIDRSVIQNDISVCSVHLPIVKDSDDEYFCEVQANKALCTLQKNGGGPVHINLETLYSSDFSVQELPPTRCVRIVKAYDEFPSLPDGNIYIFIGNHVPFSQEQVSLIEGFCENTGAVVFTDHTSNYHGKYRINNTLLSEQKDFRSKYKRANLLIYLGEMNAYSQWQVESDITWRVNEDGEIRDPYRNLTHVFMMSEKFFFEKYAIVKKSYDKKLLEEIRKERDSVYSLISNYKLPLSMPYIAMKCAGMIPKNSISHFAILNAVRNFNFFEIDKSIDCFCNTGGFGIDGGISSLIGSSLVTPEKIHFGVFGDLAFFYDMNCLGNRHVKSNLRIMVVNNASGTEMKLKGHPCTFVLDDNGIDKFLSASGHYASSSVIKDYAEDLGFEYFHADSKDSFDNICPRFFSDDKSDKPYLFEVITKDKDEEFALNILRTLCFEQNKKMQPDTLTTSVAKKLGEKAERKECTPCNEEEKLRMELDAIRHSFSFRLGRKITWLPRKIRNLIRKVIR